MTFRSSILSLTAAVIAAGWSATAAGAHAPASLEKAGPASSLDGTGRVESPSCTAAAPITTEAAHAAAMCRKIRDDLPLAGNDDNPITRLWVRHGGIWQ